MKDLSIWIALTGLSLTVARLGAQTVAIPMTPTYTQVVAVPASTTATYFNVTVDVASAAGDFIDVTASDPGVIVSLVTPVGTEVTAANASGLGYSLVQQSNPSGQWGGIGFPAIFDTPGYHTAFMLPPGSAAGVYQVKANSAGVAAATSMTVLYVSMAGVQAGLLVAGEGVNNVGSIRLQQ